MTKKSRTAIIVILLWTAVALYFISGTYARYASSSTGTASAAVAKWSVQIGGKPIEETFDLKLTSAEENEYIVAGKFAPTSTLTSESLQLDLTGTEVAVDVTATVNDTALKEKIGDSKITTEITLGGEKLESGIAKTLQLSELGAKDIKVTVKWDNDTDQHNESDTKIGKTEETLSIPVTLKVEQHIKQ